MALSKKSRKEVETESFVIEVPRAFKQAWLKSGIQKAESKKAFAESIAEQLRIALIQGAECQQDFEIVNNDSLRVMVQHLPSWGSAGSSVVEAA